ncbi:MAG: PKD domain-containing protein [Micromonosporaceae bacterium]|nr:PKD domain-containing protein [Micromonosporaceae bacterium]
MITPRVPPGLASVHLKGDLSMLDQAQRNRFVRLLLATGAAAGLLATSLIAGAPSAGATSSATSQAPVADFTHQCVLDIIMWTCSFDGSASSGSVVSWDWQFPGAAFGESGSGVQTSARYEVEGTYQVTLTVTDGTGRTDTTIKPVVVG